MTSPITDVIKQAFFPISKDFKGSMCLHALKEGYSMRKLLFGLLIEIIQMRFLTDVDIKLNQRPLRLVCLLGMVAREDQ